MPRRQTEEELWLYRISPEISTIERKWGGDSPDDFRVVLNAFGRLCLSIGRELGYSDGHADAKRGKDGRICANRMHTNSEGENEE